jgi:hypothetical protein
MSLTAKINIILNILHEKEIDLNTTRDAMNLTKGVAFTNGTGANQADTIFHDTRTLADGANETIVIDDGTLTDAFGDGVSIDEMKALYRCGGGNTVGYIRNTGNRYPVDKTGGRVFVYLPGCNWPCCCRGGRFEVGA